MKQQESSDYKTEINPLLYCKGSDLSPDNNGATKPVEVLFLTSYPPRECGIATYSQDLINALDRKFDKSFSMKICALESPEEKFTYPEKVSYTLNTSISEEYKELAVKINQNHRIGIVVIQHEFGFYQLSQGNDFLDFLQHLTKPAIIVFHTVLPHPDEQIRILVKRMAAACCSVVVMTNSSKEVLLNEYSISIDKIEDIPHGTHLVSNNDKAVLKAKYGLKGRKILSTFGLMSSGKSLETTLDALPSIIEKNPEVLFLAIGKTHQGVIKTEGEKYRNSLEEKVFALHLEKHVRFINQYVDLPVLLEYLRVTDIYLFTSKDPNQAVSGTFSYAMSCGCPIISTPIPQAREMLDKNTGIVIEFQHSEQLAVGVTKLLNNDSLRKELSLNTLHKIAPSAWENSAIAHALLFEKTLGRTNSLEFSPPEVNLNQIKHMTSEFGIFQFSKINLPDIESGYTLDDNARALVAVCMHYESTHDKADLVLMNTYLNFIYYCLLSEGGFLNYVNKEQKFTGQNWDTNLEDSNGRALWALGYLYSRKSIIPAEMSDLAEHLILISLPHTKKMYSTRAMAFSIKGLFYYILKNSNASKCLLEVFADRLVEMYKHDSNDNWRWYESYLTYANAVLPEAMLFAWLLLKKPEYLEIARKSFDFLLSKTFDKNEIKVISNRSWLSKGGKRENFGEQPIDVTYTILALQSFYRTFKDAEYLNKLRVAFSWFLGNNHLKSIIYNPRTGGCYDGLEQFQVNLNQGAESTVSYLMARLTIEKHKKSENQFMMQLFAQTRTINKEKLVLSSN